MIIKYGIAVRSDKVTGTKSWMRANIYGMEAGIWIPLKKRMGQNMARTAGKKRAVWTVP
jgi:hypothetical protein